MTSILTQAFFAVVIASARALFCHGSAPRSAARAIIFEWIAYVFDFSLALASFWAATVGQRHIDVEFR